MVAMSQRANPWFPQGPHDTRLAVPFDATFIVEPPVVNSGQKFIADIVLVDQFGEKHIARRVEFQPVGGRGWAILEERLQAEKQQKQK